MKVSYTVSDGFSSTAYLDEPPLSDGSYTGINKHSDAPVHVRWNDVADTWVAVCERKFEYEPPRYETLYEVAERPDCICKTEGRP